MKQTKRGGRRGRNRKRKGSRVGRLEFSDVFNWPPGNPTVDIQSIQGCLERSPWMFACIYRLAFAIGSIGIKVHNDKGEEATSRKAKDVLRLLRRINPEDTYQDFAEMNMVHLGTAGESYIEKARNRLGEVSELWVWNPEMVTPIKDGSGKRRVAAYKFHLAQGQEVILPAEDVIPIRIYNPNNPLRGMPAAASIWDDLKADKDAARYNRSLLRHGARPGGIVQPTEGDLGENEMRRLENEFRIKRDGPDNVGKTMVLPHGIKWDSNSVSNKDMEFLDGRKFSREIVAGILGVPPLVIGNFDSANYANAREQLRAFWDYTGKPWLKKILGALNEHWIHPEIDENLSLVVDMAQIDALVDNQEIRVKNQTAALQGGLLTVNESRRALGYAPIPDGDKLYVPLNLTPLPTDNLEPPKPEPVAPPAPPPEQDPDEPPEDVGRSKARDRNRETMRAAHEIALTRAERKVSESVAAYFKGQRAKMIEKIRTTGDQVQVEFVLGNREMEGRELAQAISPVLLDVIQDAADLTLARLGMQKDPKDAGIYTRKADAPERLPELLNLLEDFGPANPRILAYLERFFLKHLDDVTGKTLAAVQSELERGIAQGDGVAEMVGRLEAMTEFSAERAERVARTEVIGAFNLGSQEAFTSAGTPRKSWLSTRDGDRVRPSHQRIDEETSANPIPTEDKFLLVDEKGRQAEMMFPGDPEGPGWATIHCRCALVPEDEAELLYWITACSKEIHRAHYRERVKT